MALGSRSTSAARAALASAGSKGEETGLFSRTAAPKNGSSALIWRTTPIGTEAPSAVSSAVSASASLATPSSGSDAPPERRREPFSFSSRSETPSSSELSSSSSQRTTGFLGVALFFFVSPLAFGAPSSSSLSSSSLSSSQSRASPEAASPSSPFRGLAAKKSSSTGPTSGCSPPPLMPALGPDRSPSSMSSPPNAAADAPPRPARCENCGATFSRSVASKWPFFLDARPKVSRLANPLTLDETLAAMSAGVADATAVTPVIKPLTAALPSRMGASPRVVLLSFSQVMAASSAVAGAVAFASFAPVPGSGAVGAVSPSPSSRCPAVSDRAPLVARSTRRSYSSYLSPFTACSASCACTTPAVFSASARSSVARFRHRNGMCRNVDSALSP
mmetsp:Transcript_3659/g.15482  ORF Transcript_3659/g.15482 Transcript_3659/m.15482 type:complete len:390 (+) Transcript_3659:1179-2348(+)